MTARFRNSSSLNDFLRSRYIGMEVSKFGGDDEDTMKKKAQAQQDNENASVEDDWNKNDRCTTEDNISSKTMNLAAFGYQAWQLLYDHIEPISIYAQHLLFHFESSSSLSYIAAGSYSLLNTIAGSPSLFDRFSRSWSHFYVDQRLGGWRRVDVSRSDSNLTQSLRSYQGAILKTRTPALRVKAFVSSNLVQQGWRHALQEQLGTKAMRCPPDKRLSSAAWLTREKPTPCGILTESPHSASSSSYG